MNALCLTSMLASLPFFTSPSAPAVAPAAQAHKDPAAAHDQIDAFEDRAITVIGRVIHKDGVYSLRIKGFGAALGEAASGDKQGQEKEPKSPAADALKPRRVREHKVLKLNEDIRLLRSSTLEDLEEEVGLKPVETKGEEEVERSPLVQASGILTMYKGEPYIFLQHFKSSKDLPDLEKQVQKKKDEASKKP
ncbi:MAG: hypothetical protein U1E76_17260 [Planctomycetota bacterium]